MVLEWWQDLTELSKEAEKEILRLHLAGKEVPMSGLGADIRRSVGVCLF